MTDQGEVDVDALLDGGMLHTQRPGVWPWSAAGARADQCPPVGCQWHRGTSLPRCEFEIRTLLQMDSLCTSSPT
jgi:hypothetical protein